MSTVRQTITLCFLSASSSCLVSFHLCILFTIFFPASRSAVVLKYRDWGDLKVLFVLCCVPYRGEACPQIHHGLVVWERTERHWWLKNTPFKLVDRKFNFFPKQIGGPEDWTQECLSGISVDEPETNDCKFSVNEEESKVRTKLNNKSHPKCKSKSPKTTRLQKSVVNQWVF